MPDQIKLVRQLKILLGALIAFSLWPVGMGAVVLLKFHDHDHSIPFWKLGQWAMFLGIIYVVLLVAGYSMTRRLAKSL